MCNYQRSSFVLPNISSKIIDGINAPISFYIFEIMSNDVNNNIVLNIPRINLEKI